MGAGGAGAGWAAGKMALAIMRRIICQQTGQV
jgi:hypothetical protein